MGKKNGHLVVILTALILLFGLGIPMALQLATEYDIVGSPWDRTTINESEARGERIIDALQAYKETAGVYPEDLSQLVPEYLDGIEPPTAGTGKWRYTRRHSNQFVLAFDANQDHYPTVYFDSNQGDWYHDN